MKQERFVLPEKWCVKNPENHESQLLYDYTNSLKGTMPGFYPYSSGTYFHFPNYDIRCITSGKNESGYTEITFEQFKKYVLKQEDINIPNFREKGTKIPAIDVSIKCRCSTWKKIEKEVNVAKCMLNINYVSFGFIEYQNEIWILFEIPDYKGVAYYMIRESDIIELYKKQNNMEEKEIIGYKLNGKVSPIEVAQLLNCDPNEKDGMFFWGIHLDAGTFKKAKELGILDIWFTPVYAEEFQVGDYVKIIKAEHGAKGAQSRYGVITDEKATHGLTTLYPNGVKVKTGNQVWTIGGSFDSIKLEKATKEEYEKSLEKTVSVGGKFNVVIRNGKIWHKTDDITNFVTEMIGKFYHDSPYNLVGYTAIVSDVTFSKTGCQNVETKLSDWKKVYDEWNSCK